ncbi:MAG: 50S ribosomal protein L31 [Chloroflexi bacterium HGW-Chloroflexi-6]|nr:MAG: 50S ribosomal protein L31 [Chloroflexi bacterium HGW-Chloroflexi-6]
MKTEIHPKFYEAKVTCASCGTTWTTGSTKKELRVEICSNCHPFFTGEQARIIDMEGQVDRFYRKLQARQEYVDTQKAKETEKVSPKRPIAELELGSRPTKSLAEAGITEVGQLLAKLAEGEAAALAIDGFGRKSLIDAKKKLRALGYELPESATEAA